MNILVVDDERSIANSISEVLRLHGYNSLPVYDPLDALEEAATFKFDLAFLGLIMPRMCGYELGMRITALLPKCKIVLAVESIPRLDIVRAFEYLPAPFGISELLNVARRNL